MYCSSSSTAPAACTWPGSPLIPRHVGDPASPEPADEPRGLR
jgi:hypothetical protein